MGRCRKDINGTVATKCWAKRARVTSATILAALLVGIADVAHACPSCATSDEVWTQIETNSPGATLGILTLAFAVVGALVVLSARMVQKSRLLFGGALLLGAGLGAFIDGILLHQVLQWHAMVSSVVFPADLVSSKVNMFWDGVFHLFSWVATLVAVTIVVRELPSAERRVRSRGMAGGALAGWGCFNLVEGVIDHQIFALHHVHPGPDQFAWDMGFLVFGLMLIVTGATLAVPVLRPNRRPASV